METRLFAWSIKVRGALDSRDADKLSFLLSLTQTPKPCDRSDIMSEDEFYDFMKNVFFCDDDDIICLCLKHATALATMADRRRVGRQLIRRILGSNLNSPNTIRAIVAADKCNALGFPEAIAGSSKQLFEIALNRWSGLERDMITMTQWLIENGMDWRSQLLVPQKDLH